MKITQCSRLKLRSHPYFPIRSPGRKMTFQPASPKLANVGGVVTAGQCEMGSDKSAFVLRTMAARLEAYLPTNKGVLLRSPGLPDRGVHSGIAFRKDSKPSRIQIRVLRQVHFIRRSNDRLRFCSKASWQHSISSMTSLRRCSTQRASDSSLSNSASRINSLSSTGRSCSSGGSF